jgi:hypothetical protein
MKVVGSAAGIVVRPILPTVQARLANSAHFLTVQQAFRECSFQDSSAGTVKASGTRQASTLGRGKSLLLHSDVGVAGSHFRMLRKNFKKS